MKIMNPTSTGISRTGAVTAAIKREIDERRAYLDAAQDIGEITITIRLAPGTSWVRRVTWHEERLWRSGR